MADYAPMIDISFYQGAIDWARLRILGVGVIGRAGQSNFVDSKFIEYYEAAKSADVPFGMYWFYQPNLAPDLQIEAFMKLYQTLAVKPRIIFLDVENIKYGTYNILPPTIEAHTIWLGKWLSEIEKQTGFTPGVYTRADYWNVWVKRSGTKYTYGGTQYTAPIWNHWPLWVAAWTQYTSSVILPLDWTVWKIWQYEGGTGRQDGVVGPVDLDRFNGDYNALRAWAGLEPIGPGEPTLPQRVDAIETFLRDKFGYTGPAI